MPTGKAMLMLAFVAVSDRQRARRDRLASLFWPDADAEQARGSLRQTLSRLRHALGDAREAVWADNDLVGLVCERWQIDVEALARCDGRDPARVETNWAGSFLAGVHQRDAAIDAWLESERQRCLQLATRVFSTAIDGALSHKEPARALVLGTSLSALDPYAETTHRQLMRAYEASGDRAAALRQYRTLVRVLDEGLGMSPDAESRALYDGLRRPMSRAGRGREAPPAGDVVAATPTSGEPLATGSAQALRLVTVLAVQTHGPVGLDSFRSSLEEAARQAGGEAILSHGAEALFVFGLDHRGGTDAALRVASQLQRSDAAAASFACGCASGLVSPGRDGYPVGSVIQRAARLALLAEGGDLVVDRAVASQSSSRLRHESVRLRDLAGYRVLHIGSAFGDRTVELVGRRAEQAQFARLLDDLSTGTAAIAVVAGDAGMGKSSLLLDTTRRAETRDHAIVELAFTRQEASRTGPLARLVTSLQDRLLERGLDPALDETERMILQRIVDTRGSGPRRPLRDDEREQRLQLLVRLFATLAAAAPVVLAVEDCHWAPAQAIAAVVDLIDRLEAHPILLIATERRENAALGACLENRLVAPPVVYLTLTPLSRREAFELLKRHPVDDAARERILDRAGGHPLFLAQLAESGLDASEPVPMSVVAMVQAELDRLSSTARDACLKAAVLGIEPRLDVFESVFPEVDRHELAGLRLLQRRGERLVFRHALVHDAIQALLGERELRELHGRAARHFRGTSPGDYAHHAMRSGDTDMAVDAAIPAAEWLLDDNRIDEAASLVNQALDLEPGGDERGALLLCRAQVLRERGDLNAAIAAARHAFDAADDAGLRVRALIRSAQLLKRRGRNDRAGVQLRDAQRVARDAELPTALLAELAHECGNNMFMQGQALRCLEYHRRAYGLAERDGDTRLQALALGGLGDAHYAAGRLHSAHRQFRRCVELADAAGHRSIAVAHRGMVGFTAHLMEPSLHTVARMREAVAEAHRWRSAQYELLARAVVADMFAHAGDVDAAERELRDIDSLERRYGGERFAPDLHFVRTLCGWVAGHSREARTLAHEGVERFGGDVYMGASFQALLAAIAFEDDRADSALASADALMRNGGLIHNRVDHAWFASACHWQRDDRTLALATIEAAIAACGDEPVAHLQRCRQWMLAPDDGSEDLRKSLRCDMLGALTITHPRRPGRTGAGRNRRTPSELVCAAG